MWCIGKSKSKNSSRFGLSIEILEKSFNMKAFIHEISSILNGLKVRLLMMGIITVSSPKDKQTLEYAQHLTQYSSEKYLI